MKIYNEQSNRHVCSLQGDIRQTLDIKAWCDLNNLRRHVVSWQRPSHPRGDVCQCLRLELIKKNEGSEVGHGYLNFGESKGAPPQ